MVTSALVPPRIVPTRRYDYRRRMLFVEGIQPHLGSWVLSADDTEFEYSMSIAGDAADERMHQYLHTLFMDRWFGHECDLPCEAWVFHEGVVHRELRFIVRHRLTARYPRTSVDLAPSTIEWMSLHRTVLLQTKLRVHRFRGQEN